MAKEEQKKSGFFDRPFVLQTATYLILQGMSLKLKFSKSYRELIKNRYDTFNRTILFRLKDGSLQVYAQFQDGRMKVRQGSPAHADVTLTFKNTDVVKEMASLSQEAVLDYLMANKYFFKGNLSHLMKFAYILSSYINKSDGKKGGAAESLPHACGSETDLISRRGQLTAVPSDKVNFLDEPFLQKYCIADFPRLAVQRKAHFSVKPQVCTERARLITEHFKERGFEYDRNGRRRFPALRQAEALAHILSNKKPIVTTGSLLAGSTTSKPVGVVIYPEGHGITLWAELRSAPTRKYQPYDITRQEGDLLDQQVFPFWAERNVREHTRKANNFPRYQELDERFVLYFMWKTVALSHTIPDFPRAMGGGLLPIIEDAAAREKKAEDERRRMFYRATRTALEGVLEYAKNLKEEAAKQAERAARTGRDEDRAHLEKIAGILERVPARGARTLDEAVQSLWVLWVSLHNESTNAGLSLGHLDAWLQPYFEADMRKLDGVDEREAYVRHAIELIGNFFIKCQDHLPLVADVGNKLFGGSSSDQAITLGGVDAEGESAVCDMTYIFLKVTEMLTIRDPNMNARFCPGVNSDDYLRRLIEVNMVTTATPSIHNDHAMFKALKVQGFKERDAREWVATGCVEPTIPGKHFGHTNCMMFNMVASLEMALRSGVHPLMDEQVGPKTGDPALGAFTSFDDFFSAFRQQITFLAHQAIEYNNSLGRAHQAIRPTPILSSLFEGPMEKAKDLTEGGALYNTSGVACIGLTDIVDSLMTIKKLVYDENKTAFSTLINALDNNFEGCEKLHALILNRVPKFGSDDPGVNALAQRVVDMVYDAFYSRLNYRGGHYLIGFWSMSNHVAFGTLSGALPSGRPRFKPFTPGLTPENAKGVDLLSSIRTIAGLNPEKMPNNIAFNVKIAPDSRDTHEETIDQVAAYTKSYFELGGMQIQFNMVTTDMLRDAMENPQNYRNLMVRISGYNAYFVELNRDMQLEIIERQQIRV